MENKDDKSQAELQATNLALLMLAEIREQRAGFREERLALERDRKFARRLTLTLKSLLVLMPLLFGLYFFMQMLQFKIGPFGPVIGIVHIEGEIAATSLASADKVVPALKRAFESGNVTQIVLAIDSPGGAPVEAERIGNAIHSFRKKHPKPVVAAISNVGASAAYMIALHADKIIAGKYSLVGSIGAIIAPWQLSRALDRMEISQQVYASGHLKAFLNPFTPPSQDAQAKAQDLVDRVGRTFLRELEERRGRALRHDVNYASGEIWSGLEAKEIGLIDAIGTVDDFVDAQKEGAAFNFGPHPGGFGQMGALISTSLISSLDDIIARQRFQLR
ncbi:S49 family peptidase [Janthinobacterium sp. JC611]|uniref:S49 family peptidase n=1 Tax=Janthinobacterium sp. JC611 TaxID=2816201 RepID=UPI001BFD6711|nr:S49 family peptidase [Janthinobacterium sp. JC611]